MIPGPTRPDDGSAGPNPGKGSGRPMSLRRRVLWTFLFFLVGAGAATYLHWPAMTRWAYYKSDVRQSPHWAAYHTDAFRDDDLLVRLAAYNESPLQNLIYFVGTYAVDMITLGKWLAVIGYGLAAALFFWLGQAMLGFRGGALTSLFFVFVPDQFEYFAGGFSKAWMIPLVLVGVYFLETGRWKGLLWLLPLGAAAYPMSAVMLGGVAGVYLLLEAPAEKWRVLSPMAVLAVASGLAGAVLLFKYVSPPEGIGPLTPGHVLRSMPEMYRGGMWHYLPLPTLTEEMTRRLAHPFILLSAVVFLVVLGPKGIRWTRAMTALLVASLVLFLVAKAAFMDLYQPNRYTRYSLAVLLVLWHAGNWDRVLRRIPRRALRAPAFLSLLVVGFILCQDTFMMGKDTSNREESIPLCRFVAGLPAKVLIAGDPNYMDDIPVMARRSVLCNYKLAHPWYRDYYREIRRRTEATFDALYASGPEPVNRLAREWGVTHLVVVKRYLSPVRIARGNIYVNPYNAYIKKVARSVRRFMLTNPPRENVVYENRELYVLALPLRTEPEVATGSPPSGE